MSEQEIAHQKALASSLKPNTPMPRLGEPVLPIKYGPRAWPAVDPKLRLSPGLHLLIAPKAAGKTLTSLALHLAYQAAGVPTVFAYLMEPRSPVVDSLLAQGGWDEYLTGMLQTAAGGVVIVDSITYLLNRLGRIVELEEQIGKVTYKEGLTPRDILSVLLTDELARASGVSLIATLNSELFPVPDKLEGACEGVIRLHSPGSLQLRNRSARVTQDVVLHQSLVNAAAELIGYPQQETSVYGEVI